MRRWSSSIGPVPIGPTHRLLIPDPSLVVLVGAAGSGKSTLAARLFSPAEVLSSDAFREIVSGDASDQRATRLAFSILHREVVRRLARGQVVVVDATNVDAFARRALVRRAGVAGRPAVAIVLALPPALVLARNAARAGRVVDPGVVERHLRRLEAALAADQLSGEGFAAVHVFANPADVDALSIERVPRL